MSFAAGFRSDDGDVRNGEQTFKKKLLFNILIAAGLCHIMILARNAVIHVEPVSIRNASPQKYSVDRTVLILHNVVAF